MTVFRFGEFELNLNRMELMRQGDLRELPRLPMNLLLLLLERNGDLVTRQEIARELWPGSDPADVLQSINNAVTRIRYTLGDDDPDNRIVQTIVGRGYRVAVPVTKTQLPRMISEVESSISEQLDGAASDGESGEISAAPALEAKASTHHGHFALWLFATCICCAMVAAGLLWLVHSRRLNDKAAKVVFTRLTSKSPGNAIVAAAASPDGRFVVFADSDGLKLRFLKDPSVHALNLPQGLQVNHLAWLPDDVHVVVTGVDVTANKDQIWMLSIVGGDAPVLIRDMATSGVPSPDGSRIAFLSPDWSEVWVASSNGEGARRLIARSKGTVLPIVLWSSDGKNLLLQKHVASQPDVDGVSDDANAVKSFDASYVAVDASSGAVTASTSGVLFDSACLTSTGDLIMVEPNRTPNGEWASKLYTVRLDPVTKAFRSEPALISEFNSQVSDITSAAKTDVLIAVVQQAYPQVFVEDLDWPGPVVGAVQILSSDDASTYPHAWTRDGKSVLYESSVTGRNQIYTQRLDQHDAVAISPGSSAQTGPRSTYDGTWILYANDAKTIYRVRRGIGGAEEVPTRSNSADFRCSLGSPVCMIKSTASDGTISFSSLDPLKGEGPVVVSAPPEWKTVNDWDISPDGHSLVCVSTAPSSNQLHIIELGTKKIRDVQVPEQLQLRSVNSVPVHGGWILNAVTSRTGGLMYLSPDGRLVPLVQTTGTAGTVGSAWGVPSPDGSKMAFSNLYRQGNLWVANLH